MTARAFLCVALGAGAIALPRASAVSAFPGLSQEAFRARVDLVPVEVQVVDTQGEPLTTLSRDAFEVTIDGKRRRVISADLVQVSRTPARVLATADPDALGFNDTIAERPSARTFVLVFDVGSFVAAEMAPVVETARGFVNSLDPADRVGVLVLPMLTTLADPTSDRAAVRRALARVAGVGQQLGGEFHLSESEIVDITAEALSILTAATRPGSGRGVPAPSSAGSDTVQRVQSRECRTPAEARCVEAIVGEAAALAQFFEQRAALAIASLQRILDGLATESGRKTVVVISGGIAVSDRSSGRIDVAAAAREIATMAARANANVYTLQLDLALLRSYATDSRRIRDTGSSSRDRRLGGRLLEQIAEASGGGWTIAQTDSGRAALGRLLRETAAYYVLGVEVDGSARNDRTHRVGVKVNVRDATVRSRQWLLLRKSGQR